MLLTRRQQLRHSALEGSFVCGEGAAKGPIRWPGGHNPPTHPLRRTHGWTQARPLVGSVPSLLYSNNTRLNLHSTPIYPTSSPPPPGVVTCQLHTGP